MARVAIVLFRSSDDSIPVQDWLDELPAKPRLKCLERIQLLHEFGHELRRPEADYLRDDVYELRIRLRRSNCRILYSFSGRTAVVLTHALIKERQVPPRDIDLAARRRVEYERNPQAHSAELVT